MLGWRKTQQKRAAVRQAIEMELEGLPDLYTTELYGQKCELVSAHLLGILGEKSERLRLVIGQKGGSQICKCGLLSSEDGRLETEKDSNKVVDAGIRSKMRYRHFERGGKKRTFYLVKPYTLWPATHDKAQEYVNLCKQMGYMAQIDYFGSEGDYAAYAWNEEKSIPKIADLSTYVNRAGTVGRSRKSKPKSSPGALPKSTIESLVESFRGYMQTDSGPKEIERRSQTEPGIVRAFLSQALKARKEDDTKTLLEVVYYGLLPSKQRERKFGVPGPFAPSGTQDLLVQLKEISHYTGQQIRDQANLILDIIGGANRGRRDAVFDQMNEAVDRGLDWGLKLGQITPSLYVLDPELIIYNKRIAQAYELMSEVVLGQGMQLRNDPRAYKQVVQELGNFRRALAADFDFSEVLDPYWFDVFCSVCYEWEWRAPDRYQRLARQADPEKRKEIEMTAMKYVIDIEEKEHRIVEDMHLTSSYDIKSRDETGGDNRYIEIKGLSGDLSPVELTEREYQFAKKEAASYWLYVVYDIDSGKPKHICCKNPLTGMKIDVKRTRRYMLSGTC